MEEFKLTKWDQIRLIVAMLPYYILGFIQGLITLIKAYFALFKIMDKAKKNGTAICYTGVKESVFYFIRNFMMKEKPVVLHTNEGNLLLIHGNPSAKMPFTIGGLPTNELIAFNEIEKGNYILVSCHNEFHQDINLDGIKAIREENTITKYPIFCMLNPFNGKVWLTSNKEIGEVYSKMTSISINLIEEGYDNNIWRNVEPPRILKEDEVPESIKLKYNH